MDYNEFYRKNSKKFGRYKSAKEIGVPFGKNAKSDFFSFLKKYASKEKIALDVGCGSGELTKRLGELFKNVIGVDNMPDYIKTAERESIGKNVQFMVADCKKLPFPDSYFDMVISSRGPMSLPQEITECCRVLKPGGILVEETIGELDKLELKKIFKRGQNYPPKETRIKTIQGLSKKSGFQIIEYKYYTYCKSYKNSGEVADLLERAPIIDNFDKEDDKENLKKVQSDLMGKNGIILSNHRLWWVGKKK